MDDDDKIHTHTAFAFQRTGRKGGRWLECGKAMPEAGGMFRVLLDRLPIGGFSGGILLTPNGEQPPATTDDDEADDTTGEPNKPPLN